MTNDRDERELLELEAEFGELFAATRQEPTANQMVAMRQRAETIGEAGRGVWWQSLRWMGVGAVAMAAALLTLVLFQDPAPPTGIVVATNDISRADGAVNSPDADSMLAAVGIEEALAADFWFTEENEWASATSFDLFYGPMPGDDPQEWDGLYDHLLAQNMSDDVEF